MTEPKDSPKTSQKDFIEALVRGRKMQEFRAHLPRFLKSAPDSEALFQACDWYRRLGLFREGFLLTAPSEPMHGRIRSDTEEGQRLLWAARFLNLMGCGDYALQLVSSLECVSAQSHRIVGSIYLNQFDFEGALPFFQRMRKLEQNPHEYSARIGLLGLSDALCGVGRAQEAIQIARDVEKHSPEPLMQAIVNSAIGEYLAKAEDFDSALVALEKASGGFTSDDMSPDHGIYRKWRGYTLFRLGKEAEGAKELDLAYSIFSRPGIRREAAFHVLFLKLKLGMLDEESLEKLRHFPGLSPGLLKLIEPPKSQVRFGSHSARLRIFPNRDEWELEGKPKLGLSQGLKLLGFLGMGQDYGIEATRLYSLLWPKEAYSLPNLDGRLHVLLHSLRTEWNADVRLQDGMLRLVKLPGGLEVISDPAPAKPRFLEMRGSSDAFADAIDRRILEKHYGISKSRAALVLQDWIGRNWIQARRKGRETDYLCLEQIDRRA